MQQFLKICSSKTSDVLAETFVLNINTDIKIYKKLHSYILRQNFKLIYSFHDIHKAVSVSVLKFLSQMKV